MRVLDPRGRRFLESSDNIPAQCCLHLNKGRGFNNFFVLDIFKKEKKFKKLDKFVSQDLRFNFLKYFHLNILLGGQKVSGTFTCR